MEPRAEIDSAGKNGSGWSLAASPTRRIAANRERIYPRAFRRDLKSPGAGKRRCGAGGSDAGLRASSANLIPRRANDDEGGPFFFLLPLPPHSTKRAPMSLPFLGARTAEIRANKIVESAELIAPATRGQSRKLIFTTPTVLNDPSRARRDAIRHRQDAANGRTSSVVA